MTYNDNIFHEDFRDFIRALNKKDVQYILYQPTSKTKKK